MSAPGKCNHDILLICRSLIISKTSAITEEQHTCGTKFFTHNSFHRMQEKVRVPEASALTDISATPPIFRQGLSVIELRVLLKEEHAKYSWRRMILGGWPITGAVRLHSLGSVYSIPCFLKQCR